MTPPNPKLVVAAVLTDSAGRFLFQQRDYKPAIAYKGRWSLFGGVVEPEETPRQAIIRELKEEIGVDFKALKPLCDILWKGFQIKLFEGEIPTNCEISLREGKSFGFFTKKQISEMDLAFCYTPFFKRYFNKEI